MSQINFFAEHEAPLPKEEMRILNVRATAYPDRQRLRVAVEVSPFLERPNLLLLVHDEHDEVVGEASVIATMHANMEFTLQPTPHGRTGRRPFSDCRALLRDAPAAARSLGRRLRHPSDYRRNTVADGRG